MLGAACNPDNLTRLLRSDGGVDPTPLLKLRRFHFPVGAPRFFSGAILT